MKAYLYAAALLALASCTHPERQPQPATPPDQEFVRTDSPNPLENGPSRATTPKHLL